MPINRLLEGTSPAPGERERLNEAYELTLRRLSLVDRNDPLTEIIARKIIEIGQNAGQTPAEISKRAIDDLGIV